MKEPEAISFPQTRKGYLQVHQTSRCKYTSVRYAGIHAYQLVLKRQARHFCVALEVATHVDREHQVDMAGSFVGINKLVLIVLLQAN